MIAVEKLIATARNEIGYLEKASNNQLDSKTGNAGHNNYTKYARDLDNMGNVYNGKKNGHAWCDVFVDWCFITAFGLQTGMKLLCQSYSGAGAGCTSSAQYYKNKGQFYTSNPQPGDQIFFKDGNGMGHTGIVEKVAEGKVYTIEGNTSSKSGVVANGGAVRSKSYSLLYSKIGGYGRPDWAIVSDGASTTTTYQGKVIANNGLNCRVSPVNGSVVMTYPHGAILSISKEDNGWGYTGAGWVYLDHIQKITSTDVIEIEGDENMDAKHFKELWDEMRKELQDNDSNTYSKDARAWAIAAGLIAGNGTEVNGQPNYMWADVLTREQFVTVLHRFAKLIGKV